MSFGVAYVINRFSYDNHELLLIEWRALRKDAFEITRLEIISQYCIYNLFM